MTSHGETALLLGATGSTGKHVLRELLASGHFGRVVEAGRRVTASEVIENLPGKEKLVQKTIDFDNLATAGLAEEKVDVVVIVLGTYRQLVKTDQEFIKIDREYVINAARAAKPESDQRLVYLSSTGADAKSFFLYTKSKGLTEQGLAVLGYNDFIAFRPGLLEERDQPRFIERVFGGIINAIPGAKLSLAITTSVLARSLVKAATLGSGALPTSAAAKLEAPKGIPPYQIIFNKGAIMLANEP